MPVTLLVNGIVHSITAPPDEKLLYVLRDELGLTGTKYGCGEGECGACTVLLDGRPVHSCRTPVGLTAGKKITTIEGLAPQGKLHPVQEEFLRAEAFQCGYCTPGMVLAAAALLEQNANPSDQQIMQKMSGNICRCGTYPRIVEAVKKAAARKKA